MRKFMTSMFKPSKNEAQKTKFLIGGILVSFLMASYQNCGKVNHSSHNAVDPTREQKPAILELGDSNSLTLLGNYGDHEFGAYAYKINVASGEVLRTMYEVPENDPQNPVTRLCLSEEKRLALETEYNRSRVCLYVRITDSNTVCTMEYISPYAIIKDNSHNTYKLGENAKPCNDFYDLCTDNRANFIQAAKDVLEGLDSSLCD